MYYCIFWLTTIFLELYFIPKALQRFIIFGRIGVVPLIVWKKKYAMTSMNGLIVSFTKKTCFIFRSILLYMLFFSCSQGSLCFSSPHRTHWLISSLYSISSLNSFSTSFGLHQPLSRQSDARASFCRPFERSHIGVSGTFKENTNLVTFWN